MQILNGLHLIDAAREVMRQFGQMVVQRGRIQHLDCASDMLVELLAALQQNRIVGNLLRKGMLENILHVRHRRLFIDEVAALQLLDEPFELLLRFPCNRPGETQDKLTTENGQCLQEVLLVGLKPIDAGGEDRLDGRRDAQRVERTQQMHLALTPLERALVEQRLHGLLHKEGDTAGGLDDELLQRRESLLIAEQGG